MATAALHANKRKRDLQDIPHARSAPGLADTTEFDQQYEDVMQSNAGLDLASVLRQHQRDPSGSSEPQASHDTTEHGQSASDTATAALAYHTMTVPQPTAQAFMNTATDGGATDQTPSGQGQRTSSFDGEFGTTRDMPGANGDSSSPNPHGPGHGSGTPGKPTVGSEEWHKVRRDNHKEVERRRRETINEGINELAKIVPGCEKNKGQILARAVQFITQLKENETQNIEKWTLEKLLTEQAIAELSTSCDKMKAECQRAWNESERWKKAALKAGVNMDDKAVADDNE